MTRPPRRRILTPLLFVLLGIATLVLLGLGVSQQPEANIGITLVGAVVFLPFLVWVGGVAMGMVVTSPTRLRTAVLVLLAVAAAGIAISFGDFTFDQFRSRRERGSWIMGPFLALPAAVSFCWIGVHLWRERPGPRRPGDLGRSAAMAVGFVASVVGFWVPLGILMAADAFPGRMFETRGPLWLWAILPAASLHVLARRATEVSSALAGVVASAVVAGLGAYLEQSLGVLASDSEFVADWTATVLGPVLALAGAWGLLRFGRRTVMLLDESRAPAVPRPTGRR